MRYPPATTAMHATVRRSPLQVQCSSYACRVKWCGTETVGPLTDLQLPYFLLNVCLTASHSCQSNSVCSITSIRLGQLSTQLPWPVPSGGLLLYQQVMYYLNYRAKSMCFSTLWRQFREGPFLSQYDNAPMHKERCIKKGFSQFGVE